MEKVAPFDKLDKVYTYPTSLPSFNTWNITPKNQQELSKNQGTQIHQPDPNVPVRIIV